LIKLYKLIDSNEKFVDLPKALLSKNDIIKHNKFGEGKVIVVTSSTVRVLFPEVGEKELGKEWVEKNCEILK